MIVEDTIVAQASAQGNARRGIVRLSGDRAVEAVAPIFYKRLANELYPSCDVKERKVDAKNLIDDDNQTKIALGWIDPWAQGDPELFVRCDLFYWPKGRGFTGERAVELHILGAPPILDSVARTICESKIARLANRGEFTMRAFLSGRIDLTQAEAVLGTIEAESDSELQNALTQLSGNLSRDFSALRETLFDVLCDLEAGFDFVDEDIEFVSKDEIRTRLLETKSKIEETLRRAKTRIGVDQTPRVALAGRPNVGKSSLFNKLVDRFGKSDERAIVSDLAGTTRDYLEKEIKIDDVKLILIDSAGIENVKELYADPNKNLENDPRALAQNGLKQLFANVALVLRCATIDSNDEDNMIDALIPNETPKLRVVTKQDDAQNALNETDVLSTSALNGNGIDKLACAIAERLRQNSENGEIVPSTAIRCQEALREAIEALQNALAMLDDLELQDDFLLASEIRVALDRIGLVTGQVHTDDLLDRIFSKFCIGK